MPYDARPNASGDTLSASRDAIRGNFDIIEATIIQDHFAFSAPDTGKHEQVTLPERTANPTTTITEAALFARSATGTQLFAASNGTQVYQLTTFRDVNIATFGAATNGWTFLPGGLIMQYGQVDFAGSTTTASYSFTFPNAVHIVQITLSTPNSSVNGNQVSSVTTSGFNIRVSFTDAGNRVYWTAIGN